MTFGHVLLPTLEVLLAWLCIAVVLAGCGFLARRALLTLFSESQPAGLVVADLWIGLAVVLVYVQFWNLFFAVGWAAWPAPILAGIVGIVFGARTLRVPRLLWRVAGGLALLGIGVLWLANRVLGSTADYDFGLYHQNELVYASNFATIPGLANLHIRLASGDAHMLFVALIDHGPIAGAGPRVGTGLLVALLLLDIAARVVIRNAPGWSPSLSGRMSLLTLLALLAVVGLHPSIRLSSPNIDVAVFVLVMVGMLYLAECIEGGFEPVAAVAALATLASASVTRPLYWITALLAVGSIAFIGRRGGDWTPFRLVRAMGLVCVLPAALLAGWMARQAVLSGYPLFPLSIGGLPFDWRVPASAVDYEEALVQSWARWPGRVPGQVGGWTSWVPHWVRLERENFDVLGPLVLLVCAVPAFFVRDPAAREERRQRLPQMLAILIPALVTVVAWFLLAPEPRFALAAIWLIPVILVAWAVPSSPGTAALLSRVPILVAGLVIAHTIVGHGAFDVVHANEDGPLGGPPTPVAATAVFTTTSGLRLTRPLPPEDRCMQTLLCTPNPDGRLRLRGNSLAHGFRLAKSP